MPVEFNIAISPAHLNASFAQEERKSNESLVEDNVCDKSLPLSVHSLNQSFASFDIKAIDEFTAVNLLPVFKQPRLISDLSPNTRIFYPAAPQSRNDLDAA